ncbi:ATP-dependent RecD-like DNA helicase [termite gut metagenome]|uniref:ATP-dependent RecD-like DNA helicase n=1 Tax=termite gut metagenome TaxID=433724 RepID=A0A5J4QU85_9ZZZZ
MTAEQIREIAIESSTAYWDYLDENDKGTQEVDVFEISYLEGIDFLIRLRLSAKLFDTEAVFFKNFKNNKKYDASEIKIVEYDRDKNSLLIKLTENIQQEFRGLSHNDIKVISDLKFLVQRVRTWYELNGAKIALPNKPSKYAKNINNIKFFEEKELQPSGDQKESINNIFTEPFSYVWGAPGTGKTQFVLSYAILHYINNNDRVAILAPTNNSIEQVLRGIIKMTDKAGVDRRKILRLGTPSKKFAEEFPDVCEEKGVQKNLAEIDKQIDILERVLNYKKSINTINSFNDKLVLFNALPK